MFCFVFHLVSQQSWMRCYALTTGRRKRIVLDGDFNNEQQGFRGYPLHKTFYTVKLPVWYPYPRLPGSDEMFRENYNF